MSSCTYSVDPPRTWNRFQRDVTQGITDQEREDRQTVAKCNVLQHRSTQERLTKKQMYARAVKRGRPAIQPQTTSCQGDGVICAPTSSSNVPGPIQMICYDPKLPGMRAGWRERAPTMPLGNEVFPSFDTLASAVTLS